MELHIMNNDKGELLQESIPNIPIIPKINRPRNIYIPQGHGSEDLTRPRDIVPSGCYVIVLETAGGLHKSDGDKDTAELHLYLNAAVDAQTAAKKAVDAYNLRKTPELQTKMEELKAIFEQKYTLYKDKKAAYDATHAVQLTDEPEDYEFIQLRKFFSENPDKKDIFNNPKENAHDIINILGSVAIYGPGEKYPNLSHNTLSSYSDQHIPKKHPEGILKYSGVIPLEQFLSPNFTTTEINQKLPAPINPKLPIPWFDNSKYNLNDKWVANMVETFKYSVYPSPADIKYYFNTGPTAVAHRLELLHKLNMPRIRYGPGSEDCRDILDSKRNPRVNEQHLTLNDCDEEAKRLFLATYTRVPLKQLLDEFPGTYIYVVCRASNDTFLQTKKGQVENPFANPMQTQEEIFTKRVPLFSNAQLNQGIKALQEKGTLGVSPFNLFSTKNTSNVMLAALTRQKAQREMAGIKLKHVNISETPYVGPETTVPEANRQAAQRRNHNARVAQNAGRRTRRKTRKSRKSRKS
jgi:hypothetical protein